MKITEVKIIISYGDIGCKNYCLDMEVNGDNGDKKYRLVMEVQR